MLEVQISAINYFIKLILTFFLVKVMAPKSTGNFTLKTFLILLLVSFLIAYLPISTNVIIKLLTVFFLNIVIFKYLLKIELYNCFITSLLSLLIISLIDFLSINVINLFISSHNYLYENLLADILILFIVFLLRNKNIHHYIESLFLYLSNLKIFISSLFILIFTTYVFLNVFPSFSLNYTFFNNLLTIFLIVILTVIFIKNILEEKNLDNSLNNLLTYIKNFEELLYEEELNKKMFEKHLSALNFLNNDKVIKEKIEDILKELHLTEEKEKKINTLPPGLKGLIYYESLEAKKNNITFATDISLFPKTFLKKLNTNQINILCKILHIYFLNIYKTTKPLRKKNILIEIYELNDRINIVISSTLKSSSKNISFQDINTYSNLFFFYLFKNRWLKIRKEIIDSYYIEQISILKSKLKQKKKAPKTFFHR